MILTPVEEGAVVLIISSPYLPDNVGRCGLAEKLMHCGETVVLAGGQQIVYGSSLPGWLVTGKGLNALERRQDGTLAVKPGAGYVIYGEDNIISIDDYRAANAAEARDNVLIIKMLKKGR